MVVASLDVIGGRADRVRILEDGGAACSSVPGGVTSPCTVSSGRAVTVVWHGSVIGCMDGSVLGPCLLLPGGGAHQGEIVPELHIA